MLKRIIGAIGLLALALLLGIWSRAYGALDHSLEALRAASVQVAPLDNGSAVTPKVAENRANREISTPPPPPTVVPSPAPAVSVSVEHPVPLPLPRMSAAAIPRTGSPDPVAAPQPGETPPAPSVTISGTASAPAGKGSGPGPLVKLVAVNGVERIGVVIDRGVALGPLMEVAYGSGAQRMESLATEPVALFSLKAGRAVPVVNAVGEMPGTPVKICGINEEGITCVPARLRQGLFYDAASDHVLLEAGSFAAEFPGGAALFKTGPAGGLLGYQAIAVGGGAARFYPVNYFGRFSSMRSALGPLLSVAFSDLIMKGRYASESPAAAVPPRVSAPAPSSAAAPVSAPAQN